MRHAVFTLTSLLMHWPHSSLLFLRAILLGSFVSCCSVVAGKAEGLTYYQQGQYGVALYELEGAAQQGDSEAAVLVGRMYLKGQGTEKDLVKAVHWLQEASRLGRPEAFLHLAELYLSGTGLPQNDFDAMHNAQAAALAGYVPGQLLVGKLYLEGRGEERDAAAARLWFGKAAADGDPEAQYRLGQLLEAGEGGERDLKAALDWYRAAAEGGYKAAVEAVQRLAPAPTPLATFGETLTPPSTRVGPQHHPLVQTSARTHRIALLIANQNYTGSIPALSGPINDVKLLEKVLRGAGFEVTTKANLGLSDLKREVTRFLESVDGQTVSLLYYSGHGVEIDGQNYLVPTDFKLSSDMTANEAQELSFNLAVPYSRMTAKAEGSLNITILDACRDNPFKQAGAKGIGTSGGLKGLDIRAGNGSDTIETFTAYAAEAGQPAQDAVSTQANSPYAAALASQIPVPGQLLDTVFRNVRQLVMNNTDKRQRPVTLVGMSSEFFFTPK